ELALADQIGDRLAAQAPLEQLVKATLRGCRHLLVVTRQDLRFAEPESMAEQESGLARRGVKRRFAQASASSPQQFVNRCAHAAQDTGFIVASIGRRQGQAV